MITLTKSVNSSKIILCGDKRDISLIGIALAFLSAEAGELNPESKKVIEKVRPAAAAAMEVVFSQFEDIVGKEGQDNDQVAED